MSNRSVLVIDSGDSGIAHVLSGVPNVHYLVTSASGAGEALLRLASAVPDCVVFAEEVAGSGETSLTSRIRAEYPRLPLVILTGRGHHAWDDGLDAEDDSLVRLDQSGLDGAKLHEAITEALAQSGPDNGCHSPVPLALIIDDDPDHREVCVRALGKVPGARYRFAEANDGISGLEAIVSETPSIVLLDYSLPGRNGLEVLAQIRQDHPFLPVIMLTGQGNEAVAVQGIKAGALDYFNKSRLTGDSLHRSIMAAIELSRKARTIDLQKRTIRRQHHRVESSNHFLHNLLDHIPDPIFVKDDSRRWILGNRAFRDFCGVNGQSLDRLDHDLFPKEEAEAFSYDDCRALDSGLADIGEQRLTDFAGQQRLFSIKRTTFSGRAGDRLLVGVMRDITARRRAEDQFKEQTAKLVSQSQELASLGAILEESRNEIIIVDAATLQMLQVNQGGRLNLGYPHQELEQMSILHIKPQTTAEQFRALVAPLEKGEQVEVVHHSVHRRKNGTCYDVEVHIQTAVFRGRRVFVQIVFDETERKRLEKMKSEFISTVSHELRTPLTSIRGALGLVNGGACGALPEKAVAMINIANSNAERLVHLVNDILVLEKSTSGHLPLEICEIPVAEFLHHAVESNAAYGVRHKVQFVLEHTPECLSVRADRGRLMQILANLLSNAAKFSSPGSAVYLRARAIGRAQVRFEVEDKGCGIPLEFRAHIFEKFAQADSSVTRRHEGTGLGLSITKHLVEAMDGHIGYESELGAGTTFFFELPAAPVATRLPPGRNGGVRVLICEDDVDIAFIMKVTIEQAGFEVENAYTVAEARRKLKEGSFSALTLDLKMPDADGLDFLMELRSEIATEALPVIVVSARAEQERDRFNAASGLVDWLSKPIDHLSLVRAIRRSIVNGNRLARVLFLGTNEDEALRLGKSLVARASLCVVKTLADCYRAIETRRFDLVVVGGDVDEDERRELMERGGSAGPRVLTLSADAFFKTVPAEGEGSVAGTALSGEIGSEIAAILDRRYSPPELVT